MRCEGCGKFVSYEGDEEPEINSESIDPESPTTDDDTGTISVDITLTKRCGECGQDLASAEFVIEQEFDIPEEHRGEGHGLKLSLADPESTESTQSTAVVRGRKRKDGTRGPSRVVRIKNPRYMRTLYGVSVGYTVECECGTEIESGMLEDNIAASGMEPI